MLGKYRLMSHLRMKSAELIAAHAADGAVGVGDAPVGSSPVDSIEHMVHGELGAGDAPEQGSDGPQVERSAEEGRGGLGQLRGRFLDVEARLSEQDQRGMRREGAGVRGRAADLLRCRIGADPDAKGRRRRSRRTVAAHHPADSGTEARATEVRAGRRPRRHAVVNTVNGANGVKPCLP
jgi:hypothetical protein